MEKRFTLDEQQTLFVVHFFLSIKQMPIAMNLKMLDSTRHNITFLINRLYQFVSLGLTWQSNIRDTNCFSFQLFWTIERHIVCLIFSVWTRNFPLIFLTSSIQMELLQKGIFLDLDILNTKNRLQTAHLLSLFSSART